MARHNDRITVSNNIVSIELDTESVVYVDIEDLPLISQYSWSKQWDEKEQSHYVVTDREVEDKLIYLHRFLMNAPPDKQVDHIDGNTLNNKKANLRVRNNT